MNGHFTFSQPGWLAGRTSSVSSCLASLLALSAVPNCQSSEIFDGWQEIQRAQLPPATRLAHIRGGRHVVEVPRSKAAQWPLVLAKEPDATNVLIALLDPLLEIIAPQGQMLAWHEVHPSEAIALHWIARLTVDPILGLSSSQVCAGAKALAKSAAKPADTQDAPDTSWLDRSAADECPTSPHFQGLSPDEIAWRVAMRRFVVDYVRARVHAPAESVGARLSFSMTTDVYSDLLRNATESGSEIPRAGLDVAAALIAPHAPAQVLLQWNFLRADPNVRKKPATLRIVARDHDERAAALDLETGCWLAAATQAAERKQIIDGSPRMEDLLEILDVVKTHPQPSLEAQAAAANRHEWKRVMHAASSTMRPLLQEWISTHRADYAEAMLSSLLRNDFSMRQARKKFQEFRVPLVPRWFEEELGPAIESKDVLKLCEMLAEDKPYDRHLVEIAGMGLGIDFAGLDAAQRKRSIMDLCGVDDEALSVMRATRLKTKQAQMQSASDNAVESAARTTMITDGRGKTLSVAEFVDKIIARGFTLYGEKQGRGLPIVTLTNPSTGKSVKLDVYNGVPAYAKHACAVAKRMTESQP